MSETLEQQRRQVGSVHVVAQLGRRQRARRPTDTSAVAVHVVGPLQGREVVRIVEGEVEGVGVDEVHRRPSRRRVEFVAQRLDRVVQRRVDHVEPEHPNRARFAAPSGTSRCAS